MIDYGFNISLERICFSINQRKFFNNLSLKFSDSGITVILGPNGSGKTLLTKILKGLVKPTSGNVILNNQKIKVNDTQKKMGDLFAHYGKIEKGSISLGKYI